MSTGAEITSGGRAGLSDAFVSVVLVASSATDRLPETARSAAKLLRSRYANYELIIVDDGLPAATVTEIRLLLTEESCIRVLRLLRRGSGDTAAFAGVEASIGDVVVVFDSAIDPISTIEDVVNEVRSGRDIVQGVSETPIRGATLSRLGRRFFYWYHRRFVGVTMNPRATNLTGLSRRAVNSLSSSARTHRYLRHLLHFVGLDIAPHFYRPEARTVGRSLRTGFLDGIEMVSSYSTHPLRVVTVAGILSGIVNLAYALYIVVVNAITNVVEGWTTTSLQLSLMFFVISLMLAMQSEYIGRILQESRKESDYFIVDEMESKVLIADMRRRNVSS
jgi:glycosyltransferase involved in cell wall biosynthesis